MRVDLIAHQGNGAPRRPEPPFITHPRLAGASREGGQQTGADQKRTADPVGQA